MTTTFNPLRLSELRNLARDGGSALEFSPLGKRPYLLFEAGGQKLPAAEAVRVGQWLRGLAVPVIGVLPLRGLPVLRKACDVVLKTREDLDLLVRNIERMPLATAVFVQLLRSTETLPIAGKSPRNVS